MKAPIGIIGSSCRLPGGCNTPSKLWDLLSDPKDVLSTFPADRLKLSNFYHRDGEHHGSTNVKNRSYLLSEDIRMFDAPFFNINPLEADGMDPQQRLLLETVYEALESAGCSLEQVKGSQTSVYVGVMNADYFDMQYRDTETLPVYNATGTARSILSNRISYFFDLKGPSMTIDTACSSSLVALHMAVQSLRDGESTMAIVAGANLLLDASMYIAESKLHMLSPDSRCRMWDKDANGYARGEGFAAVVLKRLSDAEENNDNIECIVRETAVNSDGRTKGITMPSSAAQAALIRETYHKAGLDPEQDRCQYFECHGTGTAAGDPVEARAIRDVFFPNEDATRREGKLLVGSIKTVIGHLEGTAGLAGVLKASLAIQNRTIPPNMHFKELNPEIVPFCNNLQVATSRMPWPEVAGSPRRASVNSFGFGGTNAHVILESYEPKVEKTERNGQDSLFVGPLTFSANTEASLLATVTDFAAYLKRNDSVNLADLAWVLQLRRSHLPFKMSFSGATRQRVLEAIDHYLESAERAVVRSRGSNEAPGILGIFTGQGAQWASMGRRLIESCPLFRDSIEQCEASLAGLGDEAPKWSLMEELMADATNSRLSQAAFSQPLCTALQIALVDLMYAAGIRFRGVVGHSSGEIAATYAAGIISAKDAIRIAYYRGYHAKLAGGDNGQRGGMMAVGLSFEDAATLCKQPAFSGRLCIAASNARGSITLSGDLDAIEQAKKQLDEQKVFARQLKVDTAYHSHHMLPCSASYLKSLKACNIQVSPPKEDCVWVSSVRGDADLLDGDLSIIKGEYWVDNMVKTVLFSEAVEYSLRRAGPFDIVTEIGPHPALKGPTTQVIQEALGSPLPYTGCMKRGDDDVEAFSAGVGYLWSHLGSSSVDFDGYHRAYYKANPPTPKMLKGLPSYSWDHGRVYWKESRISRNFRLRDNKPHELLGRRVLDDSEYEMRWRNIVRLNEVSWIGGHVFQGQVLFPAAGYVAMAVEACKTVADGHALKMIELQDMKIFKATVLNEGHAGAEMIFTLRRLAKNIPIGNHPPVRAEFACYVCSEEGAGTMEMTCSGQLQIHFGEPSDKKLPTKPPGPPNLAPVEIDRFYSNLERVGLNYQGLFRKMDLQNRALRYASTSASWEDEELGHDYTLHPSLLDVAFQAAFAAHSSPSSDGMWTPFLPIGISRLLLSLNQAPQAIAGHVRLDTTAFITSMSASGFEADIHVSLPGEKHAGIQIEGLTMKSVDQPTASNDQYVFSKTEWDVDLSTGLAPFGEENSRDPRELVEVLERVCLFYSRRLVAEIAMAETKNFKWYHQYFLHSLHHYLDSICNGNHCTLKMEWMEDTPETIQALTAQYPGQIDLAMVHSLGESLVAIFRGQKQILDVLMENDKLHRYYMEGCSFRLLNQHMSRAIRQITHKYPQARLLEIGAGTGGTTKNILDTIGNAYSSYTYTDISAGFFPRAAENFAQQKGKMIFKTLDIERNVREQGFEEQSYDIIIASNVLHATRNLSQTMQHVRSLLRPGGYLVLTEVTGDLLRTTFLMGGFEGWWLGVDEGRRFGPGISPVQWNELLQETGFSGVDSVVHDQQEIEWHATSFIVSQAVDEKFEILRDPLSSVSSIPPTERILVIGGQTLPISKLSRDVQKFLSPWKRFITAVTSIDALDKTAFSASTSVISLTELDRPLFADPMTSDRWQKFQDVLSKSVNVLWVTAGRASESPHSNMVAGIGRALQTEMPQLNLQLLDIGKATNLNSRLIAEAFLRLIVSNIREYAEHDMLWEKEPEITFDNDRILIPRVMPSKTLNDRWNASRRRITKETTTDECRVEIVSSGESVSVMEAGSVTNRRVSPGQITVDVRYSTTLPSEDGEPCFLCLGAAQGTKKTALVLSTRNCSSVDVASEDVLVVEPPSTADEAAATLQAVASHLIARALRSCLPPTGAVVVYEPPETLAAAIASSRHWEGRNVFFATSRTSDTPSSWIAIAPYATDRAIRQDLPPDTKCVIDFSAPGARSIKSCVAPNCIFTTFKACWTEDLKNGWTRHDLLADSYAAATASTDKPGIASLGSVRPVQDLQETSVSAILYPAVVDWTQNRPLTVAIKPLDPSRLFSPDKTYFMVGTTEELGLSICGWMVTNGARYLVITSRRGQVNPAWLEAMRRQGAIIKVLKMDVTDKTSINSVYQHVKETMPPIAGVCNAAMVLSDKVFANMDADSLNATLKPKVEGSRHLDALFSDDSLDFFILFSSIASIVGNAGQTNYHAANMFMTSLVHNRRARGLAGSVIHIGMVVDVGYIARAGRRIEEHLKNMLYTPLSEADVHHLVGEAILSSRPGLQDSQPEIITGIVPFLDSADAPHRPPWYSDPRFSHLILKEENKPEEQQQGGPAVHIRKRLEETCSGVEAQEILQEAFSLKLESMMQLAPNSVNANVSPLELGCDSLLAVEIRNWFLKEIHVDIPVLRVLGGETVASLCNDAVKQFLKSRPDCPSDSPPAEVDGVDNKENNNSCEGTMTISQVGLESGKDSSTSQQQEPWSETSSFDEITAPSPSNESASVSSIDTTNSHQTSFKELPLGVGSSEDVDPNRVEKMSFAQSRLWFLAKYLEDPRAYNITAGYNLSGKLDVARFQIALSMVLSRHQSLQTRFFANPDNGELMQEILKSTPATMKYIQSANPRDVEYEFELLKSHFFDLEQGRTFKVTLISRAPDFHTVIFGYHHIAIDGVSWYYFLRDLKLAYEMQPMKPAPKQYVDFAVEQRCAAERGDFDKQIEFWNHQLTPLPGVMPLLPIARVRGRKPMKRYENNMVTREIGRDLVTKIKNASRVLRVTPFHFYLSVMQVLVARFIDIEDLCIGVADANRTDESIAETVGFFLNLLPVRFRINRHGQFSQLAQQTSKNVLEALQRSNIPIDLILEKLGVPRSSTHSPLFQVVANYRVSDYWSTELGECQMEYCLLDEAKNPYDLCFAITHSSTGGGLLQIMSQTYLYSIDATELLMDSYIYLLEKLSSNPSMRIQECPFFDSREVQHAISLGTGPRVKYEWPDTLSAKLDSVCEASGDSIAIRDRDGEVTYGELVELVNCIASAILDSGLSPESRIAVLCQPSAVLIAAMLAILRTGNVYVPLDLSLPPARHAAILNHCKPCLLFCQNDTLEAAHALSRADIRVINVSDLSTSARRQQEVPNVAQAKSPAFLLYTSGSTGVPKGILLTQAGFVNHLALKTTELSLGKEVVMQQSSFGFDMSIVQTFCALGNGGTLVVVPQEARGDPVEISKLMLREKVTFTLATPSEYLMLLRYGGESLRKCSSSWRHVCMGGEAVTDQLIREFNSLDNPDIILTNCYGPTEITAATTFERISLSSEEVQDYVSVGKALPNYSVYILDENAKPLPVGFPGEICIGGAGVALGYLDLPELTESKFVRDPFASSEDVARGWNRMYKTGDQGRLLADGSLVFMGRKDGDMQIKLRGLRIELQEIESAILQVAPNTISEAIVSVRGDPEFLVAHVVFKNGASMRDSELQALAKKLPLPKYMWPAMIVPLQHLPTNSNGKIDRKAIQSLEIPIRNHQSSSQETLTLDEGHLSLLWKDVLQQTTSSQDLGPDTDFFMVGGNSLLLVKLQGAIKNMLGVAISLTELYQASTLRTMNARIHAKKEQQPSLPEIVWDVEIAVPDSMLFDHQRKTGKPIKIINREVLLTGSYSFLGAEILKSLINDPSVRRVHCVAVPTKTKENVLPVSDKIVIYHGSLQDPSLGLTQTEYATLQESIDLIIHAGAVGHCLNNYSSIKVPNVHSTRFLARLALPRCVPIHYISSNRVTLLSGHAALAPISVSSYTPPTDGSQGFTATKWASECILEKVAQETSLEVHIHRPCAVTGDKAPSEDALNAILRFSRLMHAVPQFENFQGYLDFHPVQEVAGGIVKAALTSPERRGELTGLPTMRLSPPSIASLMFIHHTSGVKVPVRDLGLRMKQIYQCEFEKVPISEWLKRARQFGLDVVISSFLEAMMEKRETISFPYLGQGMD
ncbi:hypothetical protein VTN96DRAFT_8485 [Rasamsonia emersonii]